MTVPGIYDDIRDHALHLLLRASVSKDPEEVRDVRVTVSFLQELEDLREVEITEHFSGI